MAYTMMGSNDYGIQSALDTAMHRYLKRFSGDRDGDIVQPTPVAWNCTVLINPKKAQPPGQKEFAKAPLPTCTCHLRHKIEAEKAVKQAIDGILRSSFNKCDPRPPEKRFRRIVRYVKKKKYRKSVQEIDTKAVKLSNDLPKKCGEIKPKEPICCCPNSTDPQCEEMPKEPAKIGSPRQHLMRLALPVKRPVQKDLPIPRPVKRSALKFVPTWRLRALAIPRFILPPPMPATALPMRWDPIINRSALTYKASRRILRLAEIPERMLDGEPRYCLPTIKKSALKYIATNRIKKLAEPVPRPLLPLNCQEVNRSALEYVPTQRIRTLSTPVQRKIVEHNKSHAFDVSKRALKYKITERTSKLSKPNIRTQRKLVKTAPFKVRKSALKYVASKRIAQLAYTPWVFPKAIAY